MPVYDVMQYRSSSYRFLTTDHIRKCAAMEMAKETVISILRAAVMLHLTEL